MSFGITALDTAEFAPLFELSDSALAARQIVRRVADEKPGFPCRVSLADAETGETLLLLNYEHLPAQSPYRAAHAIYVRAGAATAVLDPGAVPEVIVRRTISVRAFDADGMMTDAAVIAGTDVGAAIDRLFGDPAVAHVDLHNAAPGCFAARAVRA